MYYITLVITAVVVGIMSAILHKEKPTLKRGVLLYGIVLVTLFSGVMIGSSN